MLRATETVDPGPGAPASPEAAEPAPGSGGKAVSSSVLVRDTGFQEDDWFSGYVEWSGADSLDSLPDRAALHLDNCASAEEIAPAFERITLIRIAFPSHMDGRGFSLARHLRLLGYRGGSVRPATFSRINMPWPGGTVSMKWRSTGHSRSANRKNSGCFARTGEGMTIRNGSAGIRVPRSAASASEPIQIQKRAHSHRKLAVEALVWSKPVLRTEGPHFSVRVYRSQSWLAPPAFG